MALADEMADRVEAVARDRDRAAFTALYDHFAPRLTGHLMRSGMDQASAEELAQEVMATLWRKADQFDRRKASVATWLYRIARNRRIDALRRDRADLLDAADPMLQPAGRPDLEASLSLAENEELLRAALRQLPEDQLALVRLSFFEGLSHGEIARRTGLPLGTVKSRLRLAFTRLRRALEARGVEGGL